MTSECQNHAPEFLTNSRKVVILLLNLLLFVMISITQTFAQPFLPSELSAKGISASVIGATYSAFGVTAMLSLLYLLFFFKNFGQQKLLFSIGGLVTAIATALTGQLDRYVIFNSLENFFSASKCSVIRARTLGKTMF